MKIVRSATAWAVALALLLGIFLSLSIAGVFSGGDDDNGGTQVQVAAATPAPADTATARPPVAPAPTPSFPRAGGSQPSASGVCRLQVIGPWSEINGAAPYRIEVGGGDVQHMDFYPIKNQKSVSYIVPPLSRGGVAAKWFGYGQMFQGNGSDCASFDYVNDATDYAQGSSSGQPGRTQQGHSGIVVDLRGGSFKVVANVQNLPQGEVDSLLALHKSAMNNGSPTSTQPSASCADGIREDRQPVNETWNPQGQWRVVNFWSNQPGVDQKERKLLLSPSDDVGLLGGGASWSWGSACEKQARDAFAKNGHPAVTLDQLRAEGLVR